jgi:hypothetical protein
MRSSTSFVCFSTMVKHPVVGKSDASDHASQLSPQSFSSSVLFLSGLLAIFSTFHIAPGHSYRIQHTITLSYSPRATLVGPVCFSSDLLVIQSSQGLPHRMPGCSSRCDINTHHGLVSKHSETLSLRIIGIRSEGFDDHTL